LKLPEIENLITENPAEPQSRVSDRRFEQCAEFVSRKLGFLRRTSPEFWPILFFSYVALIYGVTSYVQSGLYERDGYFHARFVQMMPQRGLSQSFPWTQLSTWRENFCDKEFLYHLAMLPFVKLGEDPILGARIFAVVLAVTVLVVLYVVLRLNQVRYPLFFTALPLSMGIIFINRLGMIRSHVLSMLLLVIGLHLLQKRDRRALFLLGFVYAWSYTVPFVLAMTAAAFAVGEWMATRKLDWQTPLLSFLGSCLGLAIHPYTPLTLETFLTYVQVFASVLPGTETTGIALGSELYRVPLMNFLNHNPMLTILTPIILLVSVWFRRSLTGATGGICAAAIFWAAMTLVSPRFVEYSVLVVVLALALLVRDLQPQLNKPGSWLMRPRFKAYIVFLAIYLLGLYHIRTLVYYEVIQARVTPRQFQGASTWMEKNLVPGETVINLFWDDFPDLFYDGYRQTYLVGLDPTYAVREDRDRLLLLEQFASRKIPLEPKVLNETFRSSYMVLGVERAGKFPELKRGSLREVYRDSLSVIYALR